MKRILYSTILIATILVGGVLGYSIWKASPVTAQQYLDSAKKYYDQKKYSEATVQLLNAIQKDARNRDARHLLALTYMKQKNLNAAAQQLSALLEYYPDDKEANLELGSLYLTGGRSDVSFFRRAAEIAEKILSKEPDSVVALILSGNAAAGLQDYHASVEQFEKAINLDPQNASAFLSLGTAEVLQKHYGEAERAYLKARQLSPKNKDALMSLANYYRAVRDTAKAEALFTEAVSVFPEDKEVYRQVVQFYYQEGRFADVEKTLHDVQEKAVKDPSPSLLLVDLYLIKSRTADAQKLVLGLKQKFPENLDVSAKVVVSFMQDEPDRARAEIDAILKKDAGSPLGQILLGELQFTLGQYAAAETTLEKDRVIGSSYPQPHFFLGNIAIWKGRVDEAQDHYQKALALDGGYLAARVALARVFLNKGLLSDSKEEIRKVLNVEPGFVPGRVLKAGLDTAAKDYAEAEANLRVLLMEHPDDPLVHHEMAVYYDSRGRPTEAEKSFLRALELQPDSMETLQALTQFYIRQKQTDRAIQALNSVPDAKKQAFHYELMGLSYSQADKSKEAAAAYEKALEKEPSRSTTRVYLIGQYIKDGRLNEAMKLLDELGTHDKSNASIYATKALIYQQEGQLDEAKQYYDRALKLDPNHDEAANNLAYILAEEGHDLQTALGLAQVARRRQPENPNNADTLGWIQYKLGNQVLARDQLKFAVSKDPNNGVFLYHLAMVYKETKQMNDAAQALKKAIGSPKDFREKPLALAALRELGSAR